MIRKKKLSSNHPDLAMIYNNLGFLYFFMNLKEKAIENLESL